MKALARRKTSVTKKTSLVALSIMFILIGGFIYLFFRTHTLKMFVWLRIINCEQIFQLKDYNQDLKFIEFLIFSLPNGLWILSFLIIIGLIWEKYHIFFIIYSSFFTGISILLEFFFKVCNFLCECFDILIQTFDCFLKKFVLLLLSFQLHLQQLNYF